MPSGHTRPPSSTAGRRTSRTAVAENAENPSLNSTVDCLKIVDTFRCVFVDREFLQRLALDTRNNARNKPTRLTHLDHRDQRRVHIQRVETSAEIVHNLGFGFRHDGAPSSWSMPRWIYAPRCRPIAS